MVWIKQDPNVKTGTVMAPLSINEPALRAVETLNKSLSFGSSALTRMQEEAIAVVVASKNRCRY